MPSTTTIEYSTEGAPLIVGDVMQIQHWRGGEDDGSGAVVTFWAEGIEKLPAKLTRLAKKGRGVRLEAKFTRSEDAAAYEKDLLAAMLKLHPGAARPPPYPDYCVWYRGDFMKNDRVFGIERTFKSAFGAMVDKLKGDVTSLVIDKKKKASGLFFDVEGGGHGSIVHDPSKGAIAVAKIATSAARDSEALARALAKATPAKLKAKGTVTLGGELVVCDSARSAAAIATHNWKTTDLAKAVAKALSKTDHCALRAPDHAVPVGACLRIPEGKYKYGVVRGSKAGKATFDALWLWR